MTGSQSSLPYIGATLKRIRKKRGLCSFLVCLAISFSIAITSKFGDASTVSTNMRDGEWEGDSGEESWTSEGEERWDNVSPCASALLNQAYCLAETKNIVSECWLTVEVRFDVKYFSDT